MIINDHHQWSSMIIINDHQWSSSMIINESSSMIINDHQWSSMIINHPYSIVCNMFMRLLDHSFWKTSPPPGWAGRGDSHWGSGADWTTSYARTWSFPYMGVWFTMENPIERDDEQGYPHFRKPPYAMIYIDILQLFSGCRCTTWIQTKLVCPHFWPWSTSGNQEPPAEEKPRTGISTSPSSASRFRMWDDVSLSSKGTSPISPLDFRPCFHSQNWAAVHFTRPSILDMMPTFCQRNVRMGPSREFARLDLCFVLFTTLACSTWSGSIVFFLQFCWSRPSIDGILVWSMSPTSRTRTPNVTNNNCLSSSRKQRDDKLQRGAFGKDSSAPPYFDEARLQSRSPGKKKKTVDPAALAAHRVGPTVWGGFGWSWMVALNCCISLINFWSVYLNGQDIRRWTWDTIAHRWWQASPLQSRSNSA